MLAAVPAPALAQLGVRHWLEKLSGPGPFTSGVIYVAPVCYGTTIVDSAAIARAGTMDKPPLVPRERPRWHKPGVRGVGDAPERTFHPGWECANTYSDLPNVYFYYEFSWDNGARSNLQYEAGDGATRDPSVGLQGHIVGLAFSKWAPIEIGAGIGGFRFDPDVGGRDPFWRAAVQPVRVNVRPLAFFSNLREVNAAHALMFSVQSFVVLGTLTDEDFGALPGSYRESNEIVWTTAVTIDVFRLFTKKNDKKNE